jgi:holo-[acyl-carrier protein] synthase
MVWGIGIDLIEVERFLQIYSNPGKDILDRLFTPGEIAYCEKAGTDWIKCQRYACRFAAKESFFKALGTGLRDGLAWKDVEVDRDARGKPFLTLRNEAKKRVEEAGICRLHLSLSHSRSHGTAVVILETESSN